MLCDGAAWKDTPAGKPSKGRINSFKAGYGTNGRMGEKRMRVSPVGIKPDRHHRAFTGKRGRRSEMAKVAATRIGDFAVYKIGKWRLLVRFVIPKRGDRR